MFISAKRKDVFAQKGIQRYSKYTNYVKRIIDSVEKEKLFSMR